VVSGVSRVSGANHQKLLDSTEWYDPKINRWQSGPKVIKPSCGHTVVVIKDNFVFSIGSVADKMSVHVLDLSSESPCWKPTVNMLVRRQLFAVGMINNSIYAVSYIDILYYLLPY